MTIRLGTRGSRLALIQAEQVRSALLAGGTDAELKIHSTHGDRDRSAPIYSMKRVGVFVEELNSLITGGEVDAAVHSAKDIPSAIPHELEVSAVLPRASHRDVLVSEVPIDELPAGAVIGTSSRRRISELHSIRDDIVVKDIRGNIDTRISKLQDGQYDGIILAEAALDRLQESVTRFSLSDEIFVPAANQGIIAVISEKGSSASDILPGISHKPTSRSFEFERELVVRLKLGCSIPAGILCTPIGVEFKLRARFYSLHSNDFMDFEDRVEDTGKVRELAERIKKELPAEFGYGFRT